MRVGHADPDDVIGIQGIRTEEHDDRGSSMVVQGLGRTEDALVVSANRDLAVVADGDQAPLRSVGG